MSGLTTVRASRQANSVDSNTRLNLVAGCARRGLTLRYTYKANCSRRKRFSAARAHAAAGCLDERQGVPQ